MRRAFVGWTRSRLRLFFHAFGIVCIAIFWDALLVTVCGQLQFGLREQIFLFLLGLPFTLDFRLFDPLFLQDLGWVTCRKNLEIRKICCAADLY